MVFLIKSYSGLLICYCFTVLVLTGCASRYQYKSVKEKLYSINRDLPVDSSIFDFYYPYKLKIDSQMNVVIATAESEIKRGRPEGRLNILTADGLATSARRYNIDFDFVHINYKTLRVPLPDGPIRTYKVFELMPFENILVTVKLKGADVFDLFQYMAKLGGDPISGASFKIKEGKAESILIGREPLDLNKSYTVLTNDYLANGGDGASVYLKSLKRKDHAVKQRDAFMEYLIQLSSAEGIIDPQMDGRVLSDKAFTDE